MILKFKRCVDHPILFNDINDDSIIFDLGSHKGEFIDDMLRNCNHTIYSYEANPNLYSHLINKYNDMSNINIYNIGIRNKQGISKFNISPSSVASSFYGNLKNKIDVKTNTLDNEVRRLNINKIDLLKIDVEGCEYEILTSLDEEILDIIQQIVVEMHTCSHSDIINRKSIKNIDKKLFKAGFVPINNLYNKDQQCVYIRYVYLEEQNESKRS